MALEEQRLSQNPVRRGKSEERQVSARPLFVSHIVMKAGVSKTKKKAHDFPGLYATEGWVSHAIKCHLSFSVISLMTGGGMWKRLLSKLLRWPVANWHDC